MTADLAPALQSPAIRPENRIALLMHGYLTTGSGKMGHGLLRYSVAPVVAVVDRTLTGQSVRAMTGIPSETPIVGTVQEAAALGADILIPGVATPGGVLPAEWMEEIVAALRLGMSLVNGLHAPLLTDPALTAALGPGRFIWDVRKEPEGLENGAGAARELSAKRILTVGTDMAIGKMTACIELDRSSRARGLRSRFLASGQIGICIAGDGVALDAVRVDFASGAVEQLVMRYGPECDLLWVEGQGSLLHPASTAWLPLMRGACPTHLILCHRAGQESVMRQPWVKIPPLREVASLYEAVASACGALPAARVVGISLITAEMDEREARRALDRTSDETGLPAADVVRFGPESLLDAVFG